MGELLTAVLNAKEEASNFQTMFERLESTLNSITHHIDEISGLNNKLGNKQYDMEELKVLVKKGMNNN